MKPFPYISYRPNVDPINGLIIAFHGWGQTPTRFRRKSHLDLVADGTRCMIVYPRGRWLNWGGWRAKDARYKDVERLAETRDSIERRYGYFGTTHLVGFSDGASFALFAGGSLGYLLSVKSVAAYSGLYHKPPEQTVTSYPILLLRNFGERMVTPASQGMIRGQYILRGHQVTQETLPYRPGFIHHRWRSEANQYVSKHIANAMREPVSTQGA